MRCPFCNWNTGLAEEPEVHLIVTVDEENRTHVHGPMQTDEDKEWIVRMISDIAKTVGIEVDDLPMLVAKQNTPDQQVTIQ